MFVSHLSVCHQSTPPLITGILAYCLIEGEVNKDSRRTGIGQILRGGLTLKGHVGNFGQLAELWPSWNQNLLGRLGIEQCV